MTLPPHYPSSPTRPPSHHIYFTIRDKHGEETRFFTHSFGAAYAAYHWADAIYTSCTEHGCEFNWIDDYRLVITHPKTGTTLTLYEHDLQNLLEYEPNKEEQAWTPPYPDSAQLERTKTFWDWQPMSSFHTSTSEPEEPQPSTPKPKPKTQNRHRSQKEAPKGMTTVAILAAEADIPANKARQILRKNKIQKPEGGWTFKTSDPQVQVIRDLFAKSS